MKRLILFIMILVMMCIATSHGTQIALSGADPVKNQVIADFLTANFDNVTVIQGDYSNPANIPAGTDVFMVARFLYSGAYSSVANSATFNALTIPVVCLTSYVARPDADRWGWHTGGASGGSSIVGNETTVTAAGAAIFGVPAGTTVDWWTVSNAANTFNAAGSGTVGGGEILATIGGNILAARWKTGDLTGGGVALGSDRLLFNFPDTDGAGAPGMPNAAGQQALVNALKKCIGLGVVPLAAVSPNPEDGAVVDLAATTSLSWVDSTDPNIVSFEYNVIFGTEPNMLLNTIYADTTKPFVLADNGIYLDYETVYYWRVDTIITWDSNEITGNWQDVAEGTPWSFTTLPDDKVPVVTADADDKNMLTFLGAGLPVALTGNINDWGEGDIASVQWDVLNFPVENTAMQMMTRTSQTTIDNLAQITSDPNLLKDWIGTDTRSAGNPMELRLKGLPAGTYSWKSYHHDPDITNPGTFDVSLIDALGQTETADVLISDSNETPTVFSTSITANGTDDVVLVFNLHPYVGLGYNDAWFVMNGFELTGTGDPLYIDFGSPDADNLMTGYQLYQAEHEVAATFTEQSYSAFGTTVSIQPIWGSIAATGAVITDTTNDPASASQSASFDTNVAGVYTIRLSATDNKPQTGSDTMTVTVTADACAAAQLAPDWIEFNYYDADNDCDVDLADLAAYAGQWLDDRNLTDQIRI